jgi:hypothetical protein
MNGLGEKYIEENEASLGKDTVCHFQAPIYEIPCRFSYFNTEISEPFGRTVWQVSFGFLYFRTVTQSSVQGTSLSLVRAGSQY